MTDRLAEDVDDADPLVHRGNPLAPGAAKTTSGDRPAAQPARAAVFSAHHRPDQQRLAQQRASADQAELGDLWLRGDRGAQVVLAAELAARDENGLRWSYDPDGCCDIRKVKPLAKAMLGDCDGWGPALRQNTPFSLKPESADARKA